MYLAVSNIYLPWDEPKKVPHKAVYVYHFSYLKPFCCLIELFSYCTVVSFVMNTLQTIQNLMVKQFDLKKNDLTPDATLESLGLDSLSVIEFMFKIEDDLKIKLPNERIELKTLQDVVNVLDKVITNQKI